MPSLIKRLKERIKDLDHVTDSEIGRKKPADPPAEIAEVEAAEESLGFRLPQTLRQVYINVANGGFGPAYGLFGVPTKLTRGRRDCFWENHQKRLELPRGDPNWWPPDLIPACSFDIVELYSGYRHPRPKDPAWQWPEKLIPLCDLGCGMYMCVDAAKPEGKMSHWEPNPREVGEPIADYLVPISPAISDWLSAWLDGKDQKLMEKAWRRSKLWKRLTDDAPKKR